MKLVKIYANFSLVSFCLQLQSTLSPLLTSATTLRMEFVLAIYYRLCVTMCYNSRQWPCPAAKLPLIIRNSQQSLCIYCTLSSCSHYQREKQSSLAQLHQLNVDNATL